jgi:phosphatidylserine decarboxylase
VSPLIALSYALPHRLLSAGMRALMHSRWRPWKNAVLRTMVRIYGIDVGEAASADAADYPHFNAFFTRALKPGARTADPDPAAVLMPADGRISQLGPIGAGRIVQAKGRDYGVDELLADPERARAFDGGCFATVYLSPRDYHRVHMPLGGRLVATAHVPGRLFSVSPATADGVPRLFARNERLVCHFETDAGPMAVVMVGALLVSGVETVWGGVEIPPYASQIRRRDFAGDPAPPALARFAEMGRFNMGSTVVVLLPSGIGLDPRLGPDSAVKVGQRLGLLERR